MGAIGLDTVYLHVTRACNLRCTYCYFSAGKAMEDELSTDELIRVLKDVNRLNPRRVVFTGGEPLLRGDVTTLAEAFKETGSGARLCLSTNGTLVDEVNARHLVELFEEVRVSVDGFEEVNDGLRGAGAYGMAMKAFRCLLEAGGDPVAFVTVTRVNLPGSEGFMRFLLMNGITKIHLSPLKTAGRARDEELVCAPGEIRSVLKDFWYETSGLRLETVRRMGSNCGLGSYITVYPDGSVYPCHLLAFPEFRLGNVRSQGLFSIYRSSTLLEKLMKLDAEELEPHRIRFKGLPEESKCIGIQAQEAKFREKLLEFLD